MQKGSVQTCLGLGIAVAAVFCVSGTVYAQQAMPLTGQTPILVSTTPDHFDYMIVDSAMGRLYASHPGEKMLAMLDLATGKVKEFDTHGEVNGVAIDAQDNKFFTAGGGQHIVVYNRKKMKEEEVVNLSGPGDDIVFDPTNDMLYVDHDDGTEVWVVNAKTDKIVGTVPVAGAPEFIVYDKTSDKLYQNIKPANTLDVIDPSTNTVTATWDTTPEKSPHGLAMDSDTHRLFSAGGNGIMAVFDSQTGQQVSTVNIAPKVDQIAFDAGNKRIYCASGTGHLTVLQEATDGTVSELADVTTPDGAHTVAVDPASHDVWISYTDGKNSYVQKYVCTP